MRDRVQIQLNEILVKQLKGLMKSPNRFNQEKYIESFKSLYSDTRLSKIKLKAQGLISGKLNVWENI